MDEFFSKVALYVTRRKPKEFMGLPADTLDVLHVFLRRKRRLTTFGTWRRSRRQPAETTPTKGATP